MTKASKPKPARTVETTPDVEKFRARINKLSAYEYRQMWTAANMGRVSAWRFKTGATIHMHPARLKALKKAYAAVKAAA